MSNSIGGCKKNPSTLVKAQMHGGSEPLDEITIFQPNFQDLPDKERNDLKTPLTHTHPEKKAGAKQPATMWVPF